MEAAFGKPCLFYRFRPQRLTLKITSAQVSEVSPAAAQIVSFLAVPAATFDTEDQSNAGRKTVSLSSPGHAVSLFRRQPFWEGFWVRSRGFAGRDAQTQPKVPTVYFKGNWRCKLHSSPGHAVSLFWRLRFGKPRWSEVEVRLKAKSRCEIRPEVSPEAVKIVSFLSVPAATFDTEDHSNAGRKMGSFSSPGHAVSLFWRLRLGSLVFFIGSGRSV